MEISDIQEAFNKVITYSQGIEDPKTDKLFAEWGKSKSIFYQKWQDYIYEWPEKVSFELDEKAKHERIINFVNRIEDRYEYYDLASFVIKQEDGFFNNIVVADYTTKGGKHIKKGMKLVRAFKYFIENERLLEDLQNEASRIIQENKVEGTLCLSVHPLDYLSLSENTHNWRSCHALDGEYRAGNLSYMMDKATVICYLRSDEKVKLPSFPEDVPWNDKKWRVLLYLSDDRDMLFAGRQYPFATQNGMDMILKEILPKTLIDSGVDTAWTGWTDCIPRKAIFSDDIYTTLNDLYVPIGRRLMSVHEVVKNGDGSKQFNDVLTSSCYDPIYSVKYYKPMFDGLDVCLCSFVNTTRFTIGGYTYCLRCGEAECMSAADTMMCYDCEASYGRNEGDLFASCDCCGRTLLYEDMYWVQDDHICPACYERYCTECEECGESVYNEDIKYHEETSRYVCYRCYDRLEEE